MYPSQQPPPPSSPVSPTTRQSKVDLQRRYRANEGECFNTLRELIRDLTGEEVHTRHEILRKAIDLLWATSEFRKSGHVQDARPIESYEMPSHPEYAVPVRMGYAAGPSSWHPSWYSAYDVPHSSYNQQGHSSSNADPAAMEHTHTGPPEYGEGWYDLSYALEYYPSGN